LLPWIVLKFSGEVVAAHCTCIAGLGECCSHIGAVLFYLQYAFLKKNDTKKSVTDVSAYWTVPSNTNVSSQKISEIDFNQPKKIGTNHPKSLKTKADYIKNLPTTINDAQHLNSFLTKLEKINSNAAILKVIPPFNLKFKTDLFPKSYVGMYKDEYALLSKEDLVILGSKLDFSLTKDECENIELITRQQAECKKWFYYRSGRITASKVKEVCFTKTCSSSISLLRTICYPLENTFKNQATVWGTTHENEAKAFYSEKLKNDHIHFSVVNSGLIINPCFPFIGASPDGITNCDCCGTGVLEIKCPYSLTQNKKIENLDCILNGKLKKTHQYHYQIQTQMFLGGFKYGDFIIWSPNNYYIERVNIDYEICNEITSKSKWYFYEIILPELLGWFYTKNQSIEKSKLKESVVSKSGPYQYCTCKNDTGGKMIMCTKEGYSNLWYHYTCIGIKRKPTAKKWKCTNCK